ncbi:MAG: NADP-dependent phosphogluconate dehydrogenase [Alphaproteobacteria bacterium]|nr:NADP-dependent phosphogluconate dehydrogenase [Alphaproteobacteria bacterium]
MTTIGLIGAGVMGRALAQNLADRNLDVIVFDRDAAARSRAAEDRRLTVVSGLGAMIGKLPAPRTVLLMVNAGAPVESATGELRMLLAPGDMIVDGGNSFWRDTQRRTTDLAKTGVDFVGLGVSGGEEGARRGPALMCGGTEAGYARIRPWLEAVAARADGKPCADWFGPDAGGHFVKMAHNAIEYGVMQAIAEAVQILQNGLGLSFPDMKREAEGWGAGNRASYLLELTQDILGRSDRETGKPLIEVISDRAGQKGTGGWAIDAALSFGVAVPTLAEAVFARTLSGSPERKDVVERLGAPARKGGLERTDLGDALFAATLVCYAQGFQLIRAGAAQHGWVGDLARAARVWRAGCILRAHLLNDVASAYERTPALANMLVAPGIASTIAACEPGWRRTVAFAASHGIATPVLSSSLAYLDALRTQRGATAMIQAMRDGFGAHGFERVDKPGMHHADWS